jgi:hypothetical protein
MPWFCTPMKDEGRTWQRNVTGRSHDPVIRQCPNGKTRQFIWYPYTKCLTFGLTTNIWKETARTETSK